MHRRKAMEASQHEFGSVSYFSAYDLSQLTDLVDRVNRLGIRVAFWESTLELHFRSSYVRIACLGTGRFGCASLARIEKAIEAVALGMGAREPWKFYPLTTLGPYPLDYDAIVAFADQIMIERIDNERNRTIPNWSVLLLTNRVLKRTDSIIQEQLRELLMCLPWELGPVVMSYICIPMDFPEWRFQRALAVCKGE